MPDEICTLSADEAWVLKEYRKAKESGFADMTIKIHAGVAEGITVAQRFKRMSGVRVILEH